MADKKVDRYRRAHTITPTQKMEASISDPGTMSMAEPTHDKGKSALVDRFRKREERWRTEQALHDQEAARAAAAERLAEAGAGEPGEGEGTGEGGTR